MSDPGVVRIIERGPPGPGTSDGNKGDLTITGNGTVWTLNPPVREAKLTRFISRAALVAAVAASFRETEGYPVIADGLFYESTTLAYVGIPDLPGMKPAGTWHIEHFGASPSVANNGPLVNAAMNALAAVGGGKLKARGGIFNFTTASGGRAITHRNKIHFEGESEATTIFQWTGQTGSLIGGDNITDFSLSQITLRGGANLAGLGAATSHTASYFNISRFRIGPDIRIEDSQTYSLAFQAGAMTDGLICGLTIVRSGSDGIDFKDLIYLNRDITIHHVQIEGFDMRNDGGKSGIDCRGEGFHVYDIRGRGSFSGNSTLVNIRPGRTGDGSRGAVQSSVRDVHCVNTLFDAATDTGTRIGNAVSVQNHRAHVSRVTAVGMARAVFITGPNCEDIVVEGVHAVKCSVGVVAQGLRDKISDVTTELCGTGISIDGIDQRITGVTCISSTTRDFDVTPSAINAWLDGCEYEGITTSGYADAGINTRVSNSLTLPTNNNAKVLLKDVSLSAGNSYTVDNTVITEIFRRLEIKLDNVSHNGAGNDQLRFEMSSDNGATWSAVYAASANTIVGTDTVDGLIIVDSANIASGDRDLISTLNPVSGTRRIELTDRTLNGGPVNAFRISWATNGFDGGEMTVVAHRP